MMLAMRLDTISVKFESLSMFWVLEYLSLYLMFVALLMHFDWAYEFVVVWIYVNRIMLLVSKLCCYRNLISVLSIVMAFIPVLLDVE